MPFRILEHGSRPEEGRFVVELTEDGFFAGHFPGAPVLPAVAQLVLVERLFRRMLPEARLTSVASARFSGTAVPSEKLDVRLRVDDERLRFVIDGPHGPVSRGEVSFCRGTGA